MTNAIAVAGRLVVESQKRRATLVVTADCASVSGHYFPDAVREYLAELHVPLVVWQVGRVSPDQRKKGLCETAEAIDTLRKYRIAVLRLQRTLERQRVVWVQGRLLPRQIEISPGVPGVTLAGQ